jgi:hypothetical protein
MRYVTTAISKRCLYMQWAKNNVMYRPIARQRLGKHIPMGTNARNNALLGNVTVNTLS